jgi:hypothetical protein
MEGFQAGGPGSRLAGAQGHVSATQLQGPLPQVLP